MEIVRNEENYIVYKNHKSEPYFSYIKYGQKTIEGRLCKDLYAKVAVGDHIIVNTDDEYDNVEVEVVGIRKYINFEEMLKNEPIKNVLPDVDTPYEGIGVYEKIYPIDQQNEFGVVAIEIKLV